MTSITTTLEKLSEGDLRELVLKLASQDKSKTLLASAHQLALAILEHNRAEQEQEKDLARQPGARYMRLKLSTPLPKVASADLQELAKGFSGVRGLEQYRDAEGKFVYHTGKRSHLLPRLHRPRRLRHGPVQLDLLRRRRRREPGLRHERRRPARPADAYPQQHGLHGRPARPARDPDTRRPARHQGLLLRVNAGQDGSSSKPVSGVGTDRV
ncbi:hypothetical protein PG987_001176 [Apiospora arundinis]